METITLSDDVYIKVDDVNRVAILKVDQWETLVQYDKAQDITKDSHDVAMLRWINSEFN